MAEHLRKHRTPGAEKAFGLWRDLPEDGLAYQERLRREWDSRNAELPVKALFDTNILLDYLKGVEAAQVERARYRQPLISIVTWMEVLAA